jgi:adenosylcobinamide-GDP ribazoletransferase
MSYYHPKNILDGLRLALSFLTRIPAGPKTLESEAPWGWSAAFYPVCGYILGIIAALPIFILVMVPAWRLNILSPLLVTPVIYVALLEYMSRMLHFDGFCDCCDAFFSSAFDRERRLEIMKDPHIGSAALCGGALLLISKTLILYVLMTKSTIIDRNTMWLAVALAAVPVFSRTSMTALACFGKYPRNKGTAMHIVGKIPVLSLVLALIFTLPALCALALFIRPYPALLLTLMCPVLIFYWKSKADTKIGGVTGDVIGACGETIELAMLAGILLATA